ncbi:MAG: type IV secretion system DNA-binding domain-containing protein [Pseudomonadota bacterium]
MKPTNETISHLAETRGRPPHQWFGINQSDRLFHQYVIGQTGTGKSTLLLQLMQQDIQNRQGFCLIDPHGDLAKLIAARFEDAIYWDAADPNCPLGYNPLTHVGAQYRPVVASSLIEALKKQWADAWGARMEHLLRYSVLALLERPCSSLQDIMPMFLDKQFRQQVLAEVADLQVQKFWRDEFPNLSYKTAADGVAPIANKLGAFLAHPVIRKSVCEPVEPLRFRQLMDEGQTLIINLAKGKLGADVSNILGGLVVSKLAHAALSRESLSESQRRAYFLYIDEFHHFTTEALADMLTDLRKYRLGLVLAHQHTDQLDAGVREAVFGNIGNLMVFRVGATDAPKLAKQLGSDVPAPADLINLANYDAFMKLMIAGKQTKAFSVRTRPAARNRRWADRRPPIPQYKLI